MNIAIKTLSKRLEIKMKTISKRVLTKVADTYESRVRKEVRDWAKFIRTKLRTPARTRGYNKGRLNKHMSITYNDGFPMYITGTLLRSFHYRIRRYIVSKGITISITRGFNGSTKNSSGMDYSEILNNKHPILMGFKERAYSKLDERLRGIK